MGCVDPAGDVVDPLAARDRYSHQRVQHIVQRHIVLLGLEPGAQADGAAGGLAQDGGQEVLRSRVMAIDVRQAGDARLGPVHGQAGGLPHQLGQVVEVAGVGRIHDQRRGLGPGRALGIDPGGGEIEEAVEPCGAQHLRGDADVGVDGLERAAAEVGGESDAVEGVAKLGLPPALVAPRQREHLPALALQPLHQARANEAAGAEDRGLHSRHPTTLAGAPRLME